MEYKDDNDKRIYFGTLEPDQLAEALSNKVDEEYSRRGLTGRYELLRRSYYAYYGLNEQGTSHASSTIMADGEQGELSSVKINQYRNLVQHVLVMTTSDKPAFEVQATNSDSESLRQVRIAKGLLDYYLKHRNFEQTMVDAAEMSLYLAEGFVSTEWDPEAGEPAGIDPDTQEPIMSGDVVVKAYGPFDIIRKPSKNSGINQWGIVREWVNRWDMIARFPADREDILNAQTKKDILTNELGNGIDWLNEEEDDDEIALYTFYHAKTPALPEGRRFSFLNGKVWLSDDVLVEGEVPIYRIAPANMHGTSYGYTNFFDVLGPQKILDSIDSTVVSNQAAFGVQMLWAPNGAVGDIKDLGRGLALLQGAPGAEPKALQLTKTPAEVFSYRAETAKNMELLSGVSSVTRGQPEASLRTGPALALVQAMSIKFNSGFQRSWANLLMNVGTGILRTLQRHAAIPRMAMITGESNEPYLQKFSKESLSNIQRVTINLGSPLMQGTAGRMEVATQLLQAQAPIDAKQFINVLETGRLDAFTQSPQLTNILLAHENELLMKGEPVEVTDVDHPLDHFMAHADVCKHPSVRSDPAKLENVLKHMQGHLDTWQNLSTSNPSFLQALGIPPIPPAQPAGPEGAPPPDGGGGMSAPSKAKDINKVMAATGPSDQASRMPSAPTDPSTGAKVDISIPQGKV